MSITKVVRFSKAALAGNKDRIVVVVGEITDDQRTAVPQGLKVCALRATETIRARIVAAGGQVLTFDQLALQAPKGSNCVLIRGKKTARTANKYFGAAGKPGSHVRPRVISKGRKSETARGRH